jgi:2-polyprenyl-3-methyl-5-hydroxy-6-metoxy-1,4-benzoquinol methylase
MFSIHPKELETRRKRCRPALSGLERVPRYHHGSCNVCGSIRSALLANRDRYDFPVRTLMCLGCGLIYLANPLTPSEYMHFYGNNSYRRLTRDFGCHESNLQAIQENQAAYARRVIDSLNGRYDTHRNGSLLDIGGSAGVVAASVGARFGCSVTVLDPSREEIAAANSIGVEGIVGSLETYRPQQEFDIVLLCRSIEHLSDLKSSLLKIRKLLKPNGLFYCDIVEFLESCRRDGAVETTTKIDHCYWLCQETAPIIFASLGFQIISADVATRSDTIGYVLRPCEPERNSHAAETTIHSIIRSLREINTDWHKQGQANRGLVDRVRWLAYRAKRRLLLFFSSQESMSSASAFSHDREPKMTNSHRPIESEHQEKQRMSA